MRSFILLCITLPLIIGCGKQHTRYDTIYDSIQAGDVKDMVRHLRNGTPLETNTSRDITPLQVAVQNGKIACAEELVRRGADLKVLTNERYNLFFYAVGSGDTAAVSFAIRHGLDPDDTAGIVMPALCIAAALEDEGVISYLLDHGANPNLTARSGLSPLHEVAFRGNIRLIDLLIDAGAAVDGPNPHVFETPLCQAIYGRKSDVALRLAERGADLHRKEIWSHVGRPAEYARSLRLLVLADELDKLSGDYIPSPPPVAKLPRPRPLPSADDLLLALDYRDTTTLENLIHQLPNIDYMVQGRTLLWYAVSDRSALMVSWLVKRGANPSAETKSGDPPPYELALVRGYANIVPLLALSSTQ